ncbi:mortality factor 4-like protein 1 [Fonsecaea erecta]|uniref:Chromatin modification-related protein EAF3 n=1 Tax=Fonsecaea erecta TaxID=1367422 RepID=A0A178ZKR0_9EURO|nr:mortality factor 4-like protein 1 [Fonsecaea erecta]OAP59615.1 mortality factor 4-like protein 1 [Fonsecaea erecta]
MAPPSQSQSNDNRPLYHKDEKALCFHGEMLYDAKITDVERSDPDDETSPFHYKVHYKGWKNTWDDWVPQDRLRKISEENRELQATLRHQAILKANPKMAGKIRRGQGSDIGSGRGSEERTSSVPAAGGRGSKRARDNDLEKVGDDSPSHKRTRVNPHVTRDDDDDDDDFEPRLDTIPWTPGSPKNKDARRNVEKVKETPEASTSIASQLGDVDDNLDQLNTEEDQPVAKPSPGIQQRRNDDIDLTQFLYVPRKAALKATTAIAQSNSRTVQPPIKNTRTVRGKGKTKVGKTSATKGPKAQKAFGSIRSAELPSNTESKAEGAETKEDANSVKRSVRAAAAAAASLAKSKSMLTSTITTTSTSIQTGSDDESNSSESPRSSATPEAVHSKKLGNINRQLRSSKGGMASQPQLLLRPWKIKDTTNYTASEVEGLIALSPPEDEPEFLSQSSFQVSVKHKKMYNAPLIGGTTYLEKHAIDNELRDARRNGKQYSLASRRGQTQELPPHFEELPSDIDSDGDGEDPGAFEVDPPGSNTPLDALKYPNRLIEKINSDGDKFPLGWSEEHLKCIPDSGLVGIREELLAKLPYSVLENRPHWVLKEVPNSAPFWDRYEQENEGDIIKGFIAKAKRTSTDDHHALHVLANVATEQAFEAAAQASRCIGTITADDIAAAAQASQPVTITSHDLDLEGRSCKRCIRYKEDAFYTRPSVRINVPDHLKNLLVDDWENVTKSLLLVPLPSKAPANYIIDEYFNYEKMNRRLCSPDADILEEFCAGLKMYFEKAVRKLWESGRHKEWEGKGPGDCYGAEHLTRMIVNLPEMIAQTNMDADAVLRLKTELSKFVVWLSRNSEKYFCAKYEKPSAEYLENTQ